MSAPYHPPGGLTRTRSLTRCTRACTRVQTCACGAHGHRGDMETLAAHGVYNSGSRPSRRARERPPLAGSPRAELEHAVTEASSTCFLEIDTLPSHGRHAHHRRQRQPSESRSSPVGDPSCSSSSSLSCSLLLSSTSSSLPSVL